MKENEILIFSIYPPFDYSPSDRDTDTRISIVDSPPQEI